MLPHQLRVVEERAELRDKITKLNVFLSTPLFSSLEEIERISLEHQLGFMQKYHNILTDRIVRFK